MVDLRMLICHAHSSHRDYSSHLQHYRSQCEEMIGEVTTVLDAMAAMKEKHQFVSNKTQALHEACEQLVLEQVGLAV